MILQKITLHNFRSFKHQELYINKYSLLVGENNSGKTNIMRALRIFYEDNVKFDEKIDFPKFREISDQESWIELEFLTSSKEQEGLKDEYKTKDKILRVRKIFKTNHCCPIKIALPAMVHPERFVVVQALRSIYQ